MATEKIASLRLLHARDWSEDTTANVVEWLRHQIDLIVSEGDTLASHYLATYELETRDVPKC
jgi:hypothetical protein